MKGSRQAGRIASPFRQTPPTAAQSSGRALAVNNWHKSPRHAARLIFGARPRLRQGLCERRLRTCAAASRRPARARRRPGARRARRRAPGRAARPARRRGPRPGTRPAGAPAPRPAAPARPDRVTYPVTRRARRHRTLPAQEPRAYGALGYRNARSWRATAGNIAARSRTLSRVTYVLTAERRRGGAARLRGQGAEPVQAGQRGHAGGRHAAQRLRISKCRVPLRAARAAGRRP